MDTVRVISLLLLAGLALLAVGIGSVLLQRARARSQLLPEDFALAAAWVFVVAGLLWLGVFLGEGTLLGFTAPWTWLAAAHFGAAGYGALTVTALACRAVTGAPSLRLLRFLLMAHPLAYLVTAAGILGVPAGDELGASAYLGIFVLQFVAFMLGRPYRIARGPRSLAIVALAVPIFTMIPALAWAWQQPIFGLEGMIRYHGLVNAIGHVGLGLVAFGWGCAPSHASPRESERSSP